MFFGLWGNDLPSESGFGLGLGGAGESLRQRELVTRAVLILIHCCNTPVPGNGFKLRCAGEWTQEKYTVIRSQPGEPRAL